MSIFLLPAEARGAIIEAKTVGGELAATQSLADDIYVLSKLEKAPDSWCYPQVPTPYTSMRHLEGRTIQGQWLGDVSPGTNVLHYGLRVRAESAYSYTDFVARVPNVRDPGPTGALLLITRERGLSEEMLRAGVAEFAAWHVTRSQVSILDLATEPVEHGIRRLDPQWPVDSLLGRRVGVVGLGSIGGVVADALGGYGVGTLDLIDPDWFLWHNQVRHVLGPEAVGRKKVDGMAVYLNRRWPETAVNRHPLNVVADAHLMRPLFANLDAVVCAADGIAPRRVVSHLANRATIPAVLACVLDDGAIGEVLRLRPGARYGCLLCHRALLSKQGSLDVEVLQERDYGTGLVHRPMTAVGPDLWLVAHLAAKAAVGTMLEAGLGDASHRLPGEHAVIGLRPSANLPPEPFDVTNAEQIRWGEVPPPRENCPTCSAA